MNAAPHLRPLFLVAATVLLAGCSRDARIQRALGRAQTHFGAGTYESAIIEYHNVLQLDPNHRGATERLAAIWLARGAPMRALPHLTRAHTMAAWNLDTRRELLKLSYSLGKWADTRDHASAILAREPDDGDALLLLAATARTPEQIQAVEKALRGADRARAGHQAASALLAQHRDNPSAARTHLQRAIAAAPRWPRIRSLHAAVLSGRNEPGQARAEYQRAAELAGARSEEQVRYAEYLARTGEGPAAIACLQQVARQAPDYIPAWRGLAEIALAGRQFEEADRFLRNAFRYDPANYDCEMTRARSLLAQGRGQAAVEVLIALGRQFPGAAADKHQLSLAYLTLNDAPRAKHAILNACVQNPDNDEAALLLAQLELTTGNPEAAAIAMMKLLSVRPNLRPAEMLLLDALKTMGRLGDAVSHLRQRIQKTPGQAEPQRLLGLLLKYQGELDEARAVLLRSLEFSPGFLPVELELVDLDLEQRRFDSAASRVSFLERQRPGLPAVHLLAARVHAARGQWEQAESNLVRALAVEGYATAAYDAFRRLLANAGADVAVRRVEGFLAKRPDDFGALLLAAEVYVRAGADEQARMAYERCLVLRPASTVVLNNLASLCDERLKEPQRALELALRARQLDQNTPAIADTLGMIHYRRADYASALPLLSESASKQPTSPEAHYNLGLCCQALGQKDEARAAFLRATILPRDFAGRRDAETRLGQLGGPPHPIATAAPAN